MGLAPQPMEDYPRTNESVSVGSTGLTLASRLLSNANTWVPWLGAIFWVVLWVWVVLPPSDIEEAALKQLERESTWTEPDRLEVALEIEGFQVQQKSAYSDNRTTWLDLKSERARSLPGKESSYLLSNVEIRIVTKAESVEDGDGKSKDASYDLANISRKTDIAWFLIRAATGDLSKLSDNIELRGDVQIFGYTRDGVLTDWLATERLLYDTEKGRILSKERATYEGRGYLKDRPCRAFIDTDLGLEDVKINDIIEIESFEAEYATPVRVPSLRPPYDPPEALGFLDP